MACSNLPDGNGTLRPLGGSASVSRGHPFCWSRAPSVPRACKWAPRRPGRSEMAGSIAGMAGRPNSQRTSASSIWRGTTMPVEIVCECGRPIKLSNSAVAHHLASLRRRRRGWTKGRKREPLEDRRYREGNQWMREQYVQLGRRLSELFGANVSSNSWEYDVSALRRAMTLTQKEFS